MKKTLIKVLSSTIALTLVLASAGVGTAPAGKIPADEIKAVKATVAVQEVKVEEKEVKEDGILAAVEAKMKEEAIAKVKEAEVPSVEIAKTAAAAEITAPKAEAKEETKAVPEIKIVPAAEAKEEVPAAEAEVPEAEAAAPEILEEEPAMEWNISATEFDNVAMSFYAEPVSPVSKVTIEEGKVYIEGRGAMEEAIYRHFMSTEKYLAAVEILFEDEYCEDVELVYDENITDVLELDSNIHCYSYETGEELFVTEDMRLNLNPADLLAFSPTEIYIAEGITNISNYAFTCCDIEKITLPSTIRTIGQCAFQYCASLRTVTIPEGAVIEDDAFAYCHWLETIQVASDIFYNGGSIPTGYQYNTSIIRTYTPEEIEILVYGEIY